jgi:hypothetical protein
MHEEPKNARFAEEKLTRVGKRNDNCSFSLMSLKIVIYFLYVPFVLFLIKRFENSSLLRCWATSIAHWLPMFLRKVTPSSSRVTKDKRGRFLRNYYSQYK